MISRAEDVTAADSSGGVVPRVDYSCRYGLAFLRKWRPSFIAALLVLLAVGCDESFDPRQESDKVFSIYGVLDVSADTQWIRVMPIREFTTTDADPIDAKVTLTDLGKSRTITLRDSLFRFTSVNPGSTGALYVHNFWTTEKIEAGARYRVDVTRSDGAASTAEVAIPKQFEIASVGIRLANANFGYLRLVGADYLAMVRVFHYVTPGCEGVAPFFVSPQALSPRTANFWDVPVARNVTAGVLPTGCDFVWREIEVVGSGSEWLFKPEFTTLVAAIPEVASNISEGVGFVGGAITKTVPYETCSLVPPTTALYCELSYSAASAKFSGVVMDGNCGGPIRGQPVTLQEIKSPAAGAIIRTASTDRGGNFQIGGLIAGVRYQSRVGGGQFETAVDTVQLVAGEQRSTITELSHTGLFSC